MSPRVSIVVTNYNGLENLQLCLPGVVAAARDPVDEVILVDDCSSDGSVAWVTANLPRVKVLALERRSSFHGAANAGFRAARSPLVALLSSDMVPPADFVLPLLPHFADPAVFAVSASLRGPTGELESGRTIGLFALGSLQLVNSAKRYRPFGWWVHARDDRTAPTFFTGGNALYDRAKFLELGGFDALYHPFYWEDADLCFRAWKRGWRVLHEPASEVVHHRRLGAIKKSFDRSYIRVVRSRNRLLFLWRNLTDPLHWVQHVAALLALLPFAWLTGTLQFYRALAGALAKVGEVRARRRAAPPQTRSDREILRAVLIDPSRSVEA